MHFLKSTTWEQIFVGWRQREANNPDWIGCATNIKGWPDWESWRRFSASQFKADIRNWQIFQFDNPIEEIPAMLVGPYNGWQNRHPNRLDFTFSDLLKMPTEFVYWQEHRAIKSMLSNFPSPTEFIGLIREDNSKIICMEGHHRATAVAVAKKQGMKINFRNNPTIALARLPLAEIDLLDIMLQRGSTKDIPTNYAS